MSQSSTISQSRLPRPIHDHNMPFLDHRGNHAIMSWHNNSAEDPGLPLLWCWAFYFVHPEFDFSLEGYDGAKFKRGLFANVAEAEFMKERFEFYYLPDATPEDCVEHYRAEMEKRGTVWEDLERLKQAQDGYAQGSHYKGLPGLVPDPADDDQISCYKGAIFMSQDADWDPEHNARKLCLVEFDPIPQYYGPGEKIFFNPIEHPIHPTWMDAIEGVAEWIEDCRRSNCPNEFLSTASANKRASSMGWNSW